MVDREQTAIAINGPVICYSSDWTLLKAAEVLSREAHPHSEIIPVSDVNQLQALLAQVSPRCLILALTPRNHVGLLYNLRRQNRIVPLIIFHEGIRMSDEAVADYIGRTLLIDSTGMRPNKLQKRLSGMTQGAFSILPRGHFLYDPSGKSSMKMIVMEIEHVLYRRLAERVNSTRLTAEAKQWFSRGEQARLIASRQSIDIRVVYQRRSTLCRYLGVSPRELPSALTVEWGIR